MNSADNRRAPRFVIPLVAFGILAGLFGLYQIDLVHQNLEIFWIDVTGQQWRLHGSKRTITFYSSALGENRRALVYLPPGYSDKTNSNHLYPVLYLLHGSPDPGDGWDRYGRAPEEMDRLIVEQDFPPMLVVLPDGNGDGSLGDSEYIDSPNRQKNGKPGKRIETYIAHDLTATIDRTYRTIQTPMGRIIGGISSGGYGAVNIGLHNPDKFSTMFSFSGYYIADPSGWARPVWGHPTKKQLASQSPMVYVAERNPAWKDDFIVLGDGYGDRAVYRNETREFSQKLSQFGIQHIYRAYPGRHSWDLWRSLLRYSLVAAKQRIPEESKDTPKGTMSAL